MSFEVGKAGEDQWGMGGSGLLIITRDHKEVMLVKRSMDTMEGGYWGIPGGARNMLPGNVLEDSLGSAVGETKEELGKLPKGRILKLPFVNNDSDFSYDTWILEIDPQERLTYVPELNGEHDDCGWYDREKLGGLDVHPGVKKVLEEYQFKGEEVDKFESCMKTRNFGKFGNVLHYVDSRNTLESITTGGEMYAGEFDRFGEGGINCTKLLPSEGRGYIAITTGVDDAARIRYFVRIEIPDGLPMETISAGQTEFHRIYPSDGDSIDVKVLGSGWVAPDKEHEYMKPLSREQLDWRGKNDDLVTLFTYVDWQQKDIINGEGNSLAGLATDYGEEKLVLTQMSPKEMRADFNSRQDMMEFIRMEFGIKSPSNKVYAVEVRLPSEYVVGDGYLRNVYLEPGDKLPVIIDQMHKFTRKVEADPDETVHISEL